MMDKPVQTQVTDGNSADNLLEALENALYSIRDAMDELKGYAELQDFFNTLDDLHDEMQPAYDQYLRGAETAQAELVAELTREYYRSVI